MTSSIGSIRTFIAALCALTMVAWLAVPAMAGEPDHAQGSENRSEQGEESRQDEPGERRDRGVQAQSANEDAPHGNAHGHEQAPPEHAEGGGEGRTGTAGQDNDNEGDPNRGTVKIRDNGYDGSPRNEPHVTCDFTIAFLGFDGDEDTERAFTIHVHPPTAENGPGETVAYASSVKLTQAEQGNDFSGEYEVAFASLAGLNDENRHPQQGWHLKLTVDGPKHKVFWIDCPIGGAALPEDENGELENDFDAELEVDVEIAAPGVDEVVTAVDEDEEVAVLAGAIEADDDEDVAAADELPVTGSHIALIALLGLLLAGLGTAALRLNRGGEGVSG